MPWSLMFSSGRGSREVARRRAWIAHLISIGCTPATAEHKVWPRMRSGKWPPKVTAALAQFVAVVG